MSYAARHVHNCASVCCLRSASVKANNPRIESSSFSSTKPRERKPSTTAGFSFRVVPPNNLISNRRSNLVKSSQLIVEDFVHAPAWLCRGVIFALQKLTTG